MRDCCNRRRAFTHLDFSPMKGIFCIQQYLFVFSRKFFEMSWSMVGSAEINIFEVCRSSTTVCCIFDISNMIELVLSHSLFESRKPTCDT